MAKKILNNAYVEVDGVDLSDHGNHIEINSEKEVVDVTGFGAASKEKLLGLGDGTISATFFQDFAAGSVDDTLWPIHSAGSTVAIVVRSDAGPISADNPEYRMTGVLPTYSPLNGDVGQASTIEAKFENAAQSGIVRASA